MSRLTGAVTAWAVAVLVAGVAGGLGWAGLAEPPRWEVTEAGTVLTQPAATHQFDVVMLFVGVGAVVGLLAGAAAGLALRRLGWRLVPLVVVVTGLAALLGWRAGLLIGPPDPRSVTGLQVGDTVPAELVVDIVPAFLVWPLAGLLGLLVVTWLGPERRESAGDRGDHGVGQVDQVRG